jgi:hypothetical protein
VKNGIFVKKIIKMKYQDFKELPFGKEIKLKKDYKTSPLLSTTSLRLETRNLGFLKIRKTKNYYFVTKVNERPEKEFSYYKKKRKESIDKVLIRRRERFLNGEYIPKGLDRIDFSLPDKEISEKTGLTKQRISQLRIITGNNNKNCESKHGRKKLQELKEYVNNYPIKDGKYFIGIFERNQFIKDINNLLCTKYVLGGLKILLYRNDIKTEFERFTIKNYINYNLPNKVLDHLWGCYNISGYNRYLLNKKNSNYELYFIDIRPGIKSLDEQIKILSNLSEDFKKMYNEEIKKIEKLKTFNLI